MACGAMDKVTGSKIKVGSLEEASPPRTHGITPDETSKVSILPLMHSMSPGLGGGPAGETQLTPADAPGDGNLGTFMVYEEQGFHTFALCFMDLCVSYAWPA
eukprot:1160266-Pelagomonas_calceolata.AAC.11